jgi:hypothetical protein
VAARRLLIVMLVLLGLSTLAAALVPQRTLREGRNGTTTATAGTASGPRATTTEIPASVPPEVPITVPMKKPPVVLAHLGDQFTLLVTSTKSREISIPEFGQLAFAAPDAAARFELLPTVPGRFGILFADSGRVAARLYVIERSAEPKGKKKRSRSRARAGSGQA